MEFNDYVGGIETGILGVLISQLLKTPEHSDRYLKEIGLYNGELDEKALRANLDELQGRMPAMLVAYVDGDDTEIPGTAPVMGQPRSFRHDCTFTVICCAEDPRGRTEQKQGAPGGIGVYKMIADAGRVLGGLWLVKQTPDEGEPVIKTRAGDRRLQQNEELLTFSPLKLSGVDYLARLPDTTCYGQNFETYFNRAESDRRGETTDVTALIFEVESTSGQQQPGTLPGVIVK